MSRKLCYDEVYQKFKENGYTLLEKEYKNNTTRMECIDKDGYKYSICNNLLQNKRTSDKFGVLNPYTIYNINNYLKINSNGSKFIGETYEGSRSVVKITCEICGKEIEMTWANLIKRTDFSCKNCKENPKKNTFEFIKKEFSKYGYKLISDEYIANDIKLKCMDADGYILQLAYSNLTNKKPNKFSLFYNRENIIFNINNYFKLNKINCVALNISNVRENKIKLMCECGNTFETNWSSIKNGQIRCSYCSHIMSNMEYKVRTWLDENNIEYVFQKKFEDCKVLRCLPFDFYLPKYNYCIEVDGSQHYKPSIFSKTQNADIEFEKRKKYDIIKTDYCLNNNINLLRISYNDIRRKNKNYIEILSNKFIND